LRFNSEDSVVIPSEGLEWQVRTWDQMSELYVKENAPRMASVVDGVIARANLGSGEWILDIGTGTGGVIERAAPLVGPSGFIVGADVSPNMLELARARLESRFTNIKLIEAPAEAFPGEIVSSGQSFQRTESPTSWRSLRVTDGT
jgi:cyclopropane fatty-acyl-phospholipid synthase-like methyltransferase